MQPHTFCSFTRRDTSLIGASRVAPSVHTKGTVPHARYRTDILVVDDDRLIRTLLTELTTKKPGRHVKAVASGPKPSRISMSWPDLIVLDVLIPDIDGITLFRRIHHRPAPAAVPVLFVSSLSRVQGGKLEGKFQRLTSRSFLMS